MFESTCTEDTAAHSSPYCGIGSWTTQLRSRAPLRNASWDTGVSPPLFACAPEGFCGFTARLSNNIRTHLIALRRNFCQSRGIIRLCKGLFITLFLTHGLDLGKYLSGWSHLTASKWSLSSFVAHHLQKVRYHSRLCSSVIYAQLSFMHERTGQLFDSCELMFEYIALLFLQTSNVINCA